MSRTLSGGLRLPVWVVLLLPVLAGCGGKRTGFVTGKVTFRGQPVTSGAVTFYSEDGRVDSGQLSIEGNYTIAQAPRGVVKVTVVPGQPRPAPKLNKSVPGGVSSVEHPKTEQPPTHGARAGAPPNFPKKYHDPDKSGLTYTVTGGEQTIDIRLD